MKARLLAAAHEQIAAKIKLRSVNLERFPRNQAGTSRGQAPFAGLMVARKQMFGDDQLQDRITEEFETLIVEMPLLFFMRDTGMRERFRQQLRVAKLITDAFFQRMHVRA